MALGFGANAKFLAAFEAAYGTPPAADYRQVQLARYGVSARQNLLDNDLLGIGRDPAPPVLGAINVDGEIVVPMDARSTGFWLKGLLGPPTTAGAGPYTHTFISGVQALPSLSIQAINPDVPLYRTHSGLRVDSATIRLERENLPSATLACVAQGETVDGAARDETPELYTPLRFGPFQGEVTKDGVLLGRVVSAELAYRNGLDRIETIRSDGLIDGAEPTLAACTGSIVVRFDGTALFDAARAGTPMELVFGYVRDANTSLLFKVHEAYLSRPGLAIEGPAGMQATFEFRGAKNEVAGKMLTATLMNDVGSY
jgi:hypothetical protein